jgi:hypothetical protein
MGEPKKDLAVFHDLFQIEDSQNDPSPTLIIQPENTSFIIPRESDSSFLDTEKAGPPTMPSHDVHDPITTNKEKEGKKKKKKQCWYHLTLSTQDRGQLERKGLPILYTTQNP